MSASSIARYAPQTASSREDRLRVGVLPWRKNRHGEFRLLLISSEEQRWTVPMQDLEQEEGAPVQVATSCVFDQAGLIGEAFAQPLGSYRQLKIGTDGALECCRVSLFSFQVRGSLVSWKQDLQRKRRWVPVMQARKWIDEPALADFVMEWAEDTEQEAKRDTNSRVGLPEQFA